MQLAVILDGPTGALPLRGRCRRCAHHLFSCGIRRAGHLCARAAARYDTRYNVSPLRMPTTRSISNRHADAPRWSMFLGSVLVLSCVAASLRIAGLAIHWKPVRQSHNRRSEALRYDHAGPARHQRSLQQTSNRRPARGRRLRIYTGVTCEGSISIGDDILFASSDLSN